MSRASDLLLRERHKSGSELTQRQSHMDYKSCMINDMYDLLDFFDLLDLLDLLDILDLLDLLDLQFFIYPSLMACMIFK